MTCPTILEHICQRTTHGLIVLDHRAHIIFWNDWIATNSGRSADAVQGKSLTEVFGEQLPKRLLDSVTECLRSGASALLSRAFVPHVFPLQHRQFRERKMSQSVHVVGLLGSDQPRRCLIEIVDVSNEVQREGVLRQQSTRLKQQAAALERTNRLLQETNSELDSFVYMASHDLKEPSRVILTFADYLREDLGQIEGDAAEDLNTICRAAKRQFTLIEDLLTLSHAELSTLSMAEIKLDQALDQALDALRSRIDEAGATIDRTALPTVHGDFTMLTLLLQNLVGNAIKYVTDAGPHLQISAEIDGDHVTVSIADNGIGIEAEKREEIFMPFRRLHGSSEYEGTGIGLSICRKVIDRHDGRIWVEDSALGGTNFRFTLPLACAEAPVV